MARNMSREPQESDLLIAFETQVLRGDYKEYYKVKRQNFFGTIQAFPRLWGCFQLLDRIWMREFDDLKRLTDPKQLLPGILFMNAHARFRIGLELGFSGCLGEAWDILRGAIESFAHAHKIIREPNLLATWINKDHGKPQAEAFKDAFEKNKKDSLFPARYGLDKLHRCYSDYSEWGTHTTVGALAQRFKNLETAEDVQWELIYTGAELAALATGLFSMLVACSIMEKAFFATFEDRLKFDIELSKMRSQLNQRATKVAADIIRRFNLQPPTIWTL